jgi:hypothetical protein
MHKVGMSIPFPRHLWEITDRFVNPSSRRVLYPETNPNLLTT